MGLRLPARKRRVQRCTRWYTLRFFAMHPHFVQSAREPGVRPNKGGDADDTQSLPTYAQAIWQVLQSPRKRNP